MLRPQVGGRAPQHQPDLVDDAGLGDRSTAIRSAVATSNANGFSQKIARFRAAAFSTWRRCSLVHVQMYTASQLSSTSSSLAITV